MIKNHSALAAVSSVSFLVVLAGCGGSNFGGYYNSGVPHTNSQYAYTSSFGSNGQLTNPDALSQDSKGNIYVASYANPGVPRVTKFDQNGSYLMDIGNVGTNTSGLLLGPQGVYVSSSGTIYVADAKSGQIDTYGASGAFVADLLTGQIGTFPYQVTGDTNGNLYVAASNLAEVIKFSPTGTVLQTFGSPSSTQPLSNPDGVAVDPSGNVYVSDYGNSDIVEYSSSGAFVKAIGNTGRYRLSGPQGITYNSTYGIFVADVNNGYVYHYDTTGNFIETVGSSSGSGSLFHPYDVAVNSAGNLLVVDSGNNRVATFTHFAPAAKI